MGRAAALAFTPEGALVVGCGLHVDDAEATVEAVRAAGGTMVSLQPCDLSKPIDRQPLIDFAVRTFGRIDVLFNNAAMAYFNWLEDISDEEWDRNRREEVDLVLYLSRAASARTFPRQQWRRHTAGANRGDRHRNPAGVYFARSRYLHRYVGRAPSVLQMFRLPIRAFTDWKASIFSSLPC
jgi:NAD(P)-dependent dehydrogenase (short-subunit alcohol dehydrogenase family)